LTVYADTSALSAAVVANDAMHGRAASTLARLRGTGVRLVTTSYVLAETLALLDRRAGRVAALAFDRAFRPAMRVIWVDEDHHSRAIRRMATRAPRGPSLVDCAGFVAMEEHGLDAAFAYDDHFAAAGFRLVLAPEDVPDP
jgi:predicted nucleic acid-binding protein